MKCAITVLAVFLAVTINLNASTAIDTLSGETLRQVSIEHAKNKSWEITREGLGKYLNEKGHDEDAEVCYWLGMASLFEDDTKDAQKSLEKALGHDKNDARIYEGLLDTYLARDKKKEFLKTLNNFQKISGEAKYKYYEALGMDKFDLDGYEDGFFWDTLEQLVRENDMNSAALNRLCDSYIDDKFYERGILFLNEMIDGGGDNPDLLFQLGRIYTSTGDDELAKDIFQRVSEQDTDSLSARQRFIMAKQLFRLEEETLGCEMYFSAARNMDDQLAEEAFKEIKDITESDERKEFEYTPSGKKGVFLISFWGRKDPTPTTEKNERLIEHYKRLEHVKTAFYSPLRPGYDERGRVYIKHGEPDQKVSYSGNWAVRENVSWLYQKNRSNPLIYHFVERNNYYRMAYRLEEALIPDMEQEVAMGARNIESLFRSRAEIHPKYDQLANEITRIQGSYQDARYGYLDDLFRDEEYLTERGFTEGETTETFNFEYEEEPMNFYYLPASFMTDSDSLSELNVYFGLPTDQVKVPYRSGTIQLPVELEVVVYDRWWQEINRVTEQKTYNIPNFVPSPLAMLPDMVSLDVPAGNYHLAVRLKQTDADLMQIYKGNFFVHSFSSPDTMYISDLVLAQDIVESNSNGKFCRNGYQIMPMPNGAYQMNQLVYVYYELYNLKRDEEGIKRINLDYTVSSTKGSLSLAKKIISTLGRFVGVRNELGRVVTTVERDIENSSGNVDPIFLAVDPSEYKPGSYNLLVTVTDSISGKKTAKDITFLVTE